MLGVCKHGSIRRQCPRCELFMEQQLRERFEEEVECAHRWLDGRSVPRSDIGGEVFSLVGRMMRLTQIDRK